MGNINNISTVVSLAIQLITICTLLYAFRGFLKKPNDKQNERLDELERWRGTVEHDLEEGRKHFKENDDSNRVTQEALLALLSHAIDGNDLDKLKTARDNLHEYLIKK